MGQALRRMKNRDIANGFGAWVELWEAKTYAMQRLRECAHRFNPKTRELADAFYFWSEECTSEGIQQRLQDYEKRQEKMLWTLQIRDKEIKRLKTEACHAPARTRD